MESVGGGISLVPVVIGLVVVALVAVFAFRRR